MKDYELKNIDSDDIDDLLVKIEASFGITFDGVELEHITTFGQFCDIVLNKIELENSNDCTSQQAFYKLRNAISDIFQIENKEISVNYSLSNFLPRKDRRSRIKDLEEPLGFQLNILRPPHWITWTISIFLLTSIIGLFVNSQIGILGLICSMLGLGFAHKIGKELDLQTVGQVAEKMTRENYLKSRRNPMTFNKGEIEIVLTDWFSNDLHIDKSKLTREAKFV